MGAKLPPNESSRLDVLRELELLDTQPEEIFEDIARVAAQVCGTPIALMSLVDSKRQWFKARVGLEACETDRDSSFCAHAILNPGELMIIPDATRDERFADNPLVLGDPQIRFYAGAPLVTQNGHALGTLCVIDRKPRQLSADQLMTLEALCRCLVSELELRRVTRRLRRSHDEFNRIVLASLGAHIAVVDREGIIIAVNEAWQAFAGANRRDSTAGLGVGISYVEACRRAATQDNGDVGRILESIEAVLSGQLKDFSTEYSCHAPQEKRWFYMRVRPLPEPQGGAVISHENITKLKQAEDELHSLSARLLQAQDEERRRLARELHDTTVQKLAGASMNLSVLAPLLQGESRELLDESGRLVDDAAQEIRTLSYLLHPPLLDELGLNGALRDYVDGFARRSGIRVSLKLPERLHRLPREQETALFRILQESLGNIHRHSGSSTAEVTLGFSPGDAKLVVRDAGCGMPTSPLEGILGGHVQLGVGIAGMRERLRQMGGVLEIQSDSAGTTVTAILPIQEAAP